jgi:hypothetical protein
LEGAVEEKIQPHGHASGDQHVEWTCDSQSSAKRYVSWQSSDRNVSLRTRRRPDSVIADSKLAAPY